MIDTFSIRGSIEEVPYIIAQEKAGPFGYYMLGIIAPPSQQRVHLAAQEGCYDDECDCSLKDIDETTFLIKLPHLFYIISVHIDTRNRLGSALQYVFGLDIPDPKDIRHTNAFTLPIPNLYEEGGVCIGQADIGLMHPNSSITFVLANTITNFWDSDFNRDLGPYDLSGKGTDYLLRQWEHAPKKIIRTEREAIGDLDGVFSDHGLGMTPPYPITAGAFSEDGSMLQLIKDDTDNDLLRIEPDAIPMEAQA